MDRRIWRTADGRHVPEGHLEAAFLAYAPGDEVPDEVLAEIGEKPAGKRGRKPADKQAARPDDKAAAPAGDKGKGASGLTINRLADKE